MRPLSPLARRTEPPRLIAIRPDGSKLWGQWQYLFTPGLASDEGWDYVTWIEGGPEDVFCEGDRSHDEVSRGTDRR